MAMDPWPGRLKGRTHRGLLSAHFNRWAAPETVGKGNRSLLLDVIRGIVVLFCGLCVTIMISFEPSSRRR